MRNMEISSCDVCLRNRYMFVIHGVAGVSRDRLCAYIRERLRTTWALRLHQCIGIGHLFGDNFIHRQIDTAVPDTVKESMEGLLQTVWYLVSEYPQIDCAIDIVLIKDTAVVFVDILDIGLFHNRRNDNAMYLGYITT